MAREPILAFSIDTTEIETLARLFPEMVKIIAKEMDKAMDEAGLLLTGMVAARTPVNLGLLRASLSWPTGFKKRGKSIDKITGTIGAGDLGSIAGLSPRKYVNFVEFDTRPHWAPVAPLIFYQARKKGLSGDDATAAGYGLQHWIAFHGTKGKKMFERAWNEGGEQKTKLIFKAVPIRAIRQWGHL